MCRIRKIEKTRMLKKLKCNEEKKGKANINEVKTKIKKTSIFFFGGGGK